MSLLERYLSEIARRLPKRQREDVRKELRSALSDALDGRVEGEANEDEVVELLREFGSPDANSHLDRVFLRDLLRFLAHRLRP